MVSPRLPIPRATRRPIRRRAPPGRHPQRRREPGPLYLPLPGRLRRDGLHRPGGRRLDLAPRLPAAGAAPRSTPLASAGAPATTWTATSAGSRTRSARIWTALYDDQGRAVRQINPLGHRLTSVFDAFGNLLSAQNGSGFITRYRLRREPGAAARRHDDGRPRRSYHLRLHRSGACGRASRTRSARSHQRLERSGPEDRRGGPLGNRTTFISDLGLGTIAQPDPLGRTSSFGATTPRAGPIVYRQNPLGFVWTTVYDARGKVQAQIDPLGYRTSFLWNAEGSWTARIDPLGNRTTRVYDAANRNLAEIIRSATAPPTSSIRRTSASGNRTRSAISRPTGTTLPAAQ